MIEIPKRKISDDISINICVDLKEFRKGLKAGDKVKLIMTKEWPDKEGTQFSGLDNSYKSKFHNTIVTLRNKEVEPNTFSLTTDGGNYYHIDWMYPPE